MTSVSLVCMPWAMVRSPSIAVGILQAVLSEAGVDCRSHSLHVAFQELLLGRAPKRGRLTIEEYARICSLFGNLGAGDWVFAVEPARAITKENDDRFAALLRRTLPDASRFVTKLRRTRELVPAFLDQCADEILETDPDVVGFTSVYSQTWPSAALGHVLKARKPGLSIVFGGASCEGPMGRATLEAFPWVDAVISGEAENQVVDLMGALAGGGDLSRIPGLFFRGPDSEVVASTAVGTAVEMDSIPVPDYDEYFERLERTEHVRPLVQVQIPFETSRGCWWGAKPKNHCTFCGLNGLAIATRSKSPDAAFDSAMALSRRHKQHDLTAVDNILPLEYFDTFLPRLAAEDVDVSIFYETKANLTRERVALLRAAGVRTIQPGIESLSTPVLKLMRKGVTALQNARLLKWSAEYGIHVIWNLLYGFPGESPADYEQTAAWIPSLVHFAPPNLSELALYRFSPYFERPADHGLRVTGPQPYYALLYDLDEGSLLDLAQSFEFRYSDGRAADSFLGGVREEVERWRSDSQRNYRALTYRRGPGFLTLTDTRTTTANGRGVLRYELEGAQARVYMACDSGATLKTLEAALATAPGPTLGTLELEAFLDELVAERLVLREGDRFLSLALPNR